MGSRFGVSLIQAKKRAADSLPVKFKCCQWAAELFQRAGGELDARISEV
jgi:hypothetical protein